MQFILLHITIVILVSIKLIYFNFDSDINTAPFRWRIHKKTVQAIFATNLILDGIFMIQESAYGWILMSVVLDLLLFADSLYMRYYKNPLTISVILHQFKLVIGIRASVTGVFLRKDILLFIDIPVITALCILVKGSRINRISSLSVSTFFLAGGLLWFLMVYRFSNRKAYFWNKKRIARDLGIIYYHISDIVRYTMNRMKRKEPLTDAERDMIQKEFWVRQNNDYTDLAKNKNVIVVQMESMQDFLINLKIEGNEVTPNLNRLMKENIRFENMYYQTGVGNTSDAEMLFNNSLYPMLDKPASYECQRNYFEAVGQAFKKKGYSAYAFHGNMASFWNRHFMYPIYGYDRFIDNSILDNDEFIFPGLSDHSFFHQCSEFLDKKNSEGRFFAFLITLSLHHPYDYFAEDKFNVGELEGTFFGRYLKGAHYADSCIGKFIEDLKDKGLYDETLLVMYGDHSGMPKQYRQELMDYFGLENSGFNYTKLQKVAAFMHIPGHQGGEIVQKTVGQIDLLPTVANLTDLNIRFALGRDIFDEAHTGGIVTRDKTVVTDEFIAFPNQKSVYDIITGKEVDKDEETASRISDFTKKLEVSDLILEKDALLEFR